MPNPIDIICEFYAPCSETYKILVQHSEQVARKALDVAGRVAHLHPDFKFIEEAAMLHDIGIFMTDAVELGCRGEFPYIFHGYLGRKILESRGLPRHALVCERHVGVGLGLAEVKRLPFPEVREMIPISIEEQIVCYADKFFSKSKNGDLPAKEKSLEDILCGLAFYGHDKVAKFQAWADMFEG
ncbi:HDIG domain-containing protein [Desulfobacterales bacterium HSG2]|nr:HDIG domain-containing protein [Desulfobacterales bacterium HSG2]